jgi:hypothetical protein
VERALAVVGGRGRPRVACAGTWDRYPQDVPYRCMWTTCSRTRGRRCRGCGRWGGRRGCCRRGSTGRAAGAGALFRLVHDLGVHRRYGAMRAYSANLVAKPTALDAALRASFAAAGRATSFTSFGKPADWPKTDEDLAKATAALPAEVSVVLGSWCSTSRTRGRGRSGRGGMCRSRRAWRCTGGSTSGSRRRTRSRTSRRWTTSRGRGTRRACGTRG